jgi:SAM-dependent methyltransferase
MKELILGCGHRVDKKLISPTKDTKYHNPTTLDINPAVNPDYVIDLDDVILPFDDNEFDEIHCYEVLEHLGEQGDHEFFFEQFSEFWRILKPNGLFIATVPKWDSEWAWGDPSHRRVITPGTLIFLNQQEYVNNKKNGTAMTDFTDIYKADFQLAHSETQKGTFAFVLKAIKGDK